MTVDEFKKAKPKLAHLEGNELLNAMEDYFLTLQDGQQVMKTVMPFFKRYQLRWVFYRQLPNMVFDKGDYTSKTRCKICKRGTGMRSFYQGKVYCIGMDHEYVEEKNISFKHKIYVVYKSINTLFWSVLDKIHLVRSSHFTRYGMIGDESKYIHHWTMHMDTGKTTHVLKKRKWWEYIFIERSQFNF